MNENKVKNMIPEILHYRPFKPCIHLPPMASGLSACGLVHIHPGLLLAYLVLL